MSAKTLKIKISLGSTNGTKQNSRTATNSANNEIDYTDATSHSKSNQPFKLAVLLTVSVVGIMSWLFFAPSSEPQPTVSTFIEDDVSPVPEKQAAVTLSNKVVQPLPLPAVPIIPTPTTETLEIEEKPLFSESATAPPPLPQPVVETVATQIAPIKAEKKNNNINIRRAQFTNGIIKREPIDNIDQLSAAAKELKKIYYFTELRGLKGETIMHQWQHENNVVAEVEFKVRGNRWRVYSSKYLQSHKKGSWQVVVKDEKGNPLETSQFTYQ